MSPTDPANVPFIINKIDPWTIIEFRTASLMDPVQLEQTAQALYRLIDTEDRRMIILDFEKVHYISSQAIGIVLTMNKKLTSLKRSKFVLCGVGDKLMQLIKITRLDRILIIKPTQAEAIKVQNIL